MSELKQCSLFYVGATFFLFVTKEKKIAKKENPQHAYAFDYSN